jgi:hypothetical protein
MRSWMSLDTHQDVLYAAVQSGQSWIEVCDGTTLDIVAKPQGDMVLTQPRRMGTLTQDPRAGPSMS